MSIASQIFLLFYAVLYGILFTISDRWRPFATPHLSRQAWYRLALSVMCFGVLPVVYFLLALRLLMSVDKSSTWHLALAIYAVAPLAAFHFSWIWIVLSRRNTFYSTNEQVLEPVKSSLEWVGETPVSLLGVTTLLTFFGIGPVACLLLLTYIGR